ncbi:hypothetical protein Pmar_PMAR020279 [Perkinsus marinus ATCC 50983]|uniref:Protein kinase domain-containing protein n=1 Tax=Perkinsus marinus (strain ATCC 50983 / TXsc) TaxID=423536 RepID=C5LU24_PERM5|nr:hypothetical protein Pmar_PMAR020279 [Perkinsus marinus ATCC 50983]EEQ99822.1 hypothetical protein Pmar_PMAR020279 [Perkinsus marinus ATCC 50983]|eukprot:XP_002767105.1 hypothetical protein Pmar_PMAR020279 [Perkinsus marinus ATCC 50983]
MTPTNGRRPSLPSKYSKTTGASPEEKGSSAPPDEEILAMQQQHIAMRMRHSIDGAPRVRIPPCQCVEKMTLEGLECVGVIHENPYSGRKVALMRNRNAQCSRHERVIAKIWPNTHLDATRQALGTRDVESRMKKLVRPLKTFTCQPGSEPVLVSTGCQSGATYFVREYCNYGDLSQYVTRCQDMYQIEGSCLGLRWYHSAKDAVRQAIECSKCVHDAGYALLDVDMSQFGVMDFRGYGSGLELDGPQPIQVKIIDAGQATALSTNSGSTIGKPSTRCPEAQRAAVQAERGIPPGERVPQLRQLIYK